MAKKYKAGGGLREVPALVRDRVRPPVCIVFGTLAEVTHLLDALAQPQVTCYQMDLFPAARLREALGDRATVETAADLWDLSPHFQTVLYLPQRGGERELKIDVIEQSYHILAPQGQFIVWSPYEDDPFFPPQLKKVFGKVHSHFLGDETVLVCHREGDRPRRRHEMTFQVRVRGGPSCRFVSRPGTFSYGRFDNGARALLDCVELEPGQRVLDLGCGCGTNGVFAWQQVGPDGHVTFVDSNLRAAALAELNARANGVTNFNVFATATVEGPPEGSYDVVLANPPYFAHSAIALLFVERGRELLKPDGRFHLVTRQPNEMGQVMEEVFGALEATESRGYVVLSA